MRTLFAVNQWLCNIFSLAPPTISRPPLAQYFPFSCDASAGRLPPSTTPLSARFSTDFAVNPSAESITHFEWLRTSALAASVLALFSRRFHCPDVSETSSLAWGLLKLDLRSRWPRPRSEGYCCAAQLPWLSQTGAEDGYGVGLCTRLRSSVVARERWYELRVPYTFPPRYRTRAHSAAAGTARRPPVPPCRSLCRLHSLPAPACRPTPALEQGGGVCGNGIGRRRRRAGPAPHRSLMVPNSPIRAGQRCGRRGREGGIPVAGGASPRGLGLTLCPHRSARPPCPPSCCARTPDFENAREDLACGWLEVYQRGGRGGGDRGRTVFTRIAARAPDFENAGGNGGWKRRAGHVGTKIWHAGGIEVTPGREGWCRAWAYGIYPPRCARAPDFENAGGNGGWKRRAGRVRAKI
ncbi:hypothetical protein B0H14DRAFT_2634935 [Mycena olivaceomarginata]|nr:hypothetical protein B0H14DRAFT_2634935 [Mycena olivaceomarginata]